MTDFVQRHVGRLGTGERPLQRERVGTVPKVSKPEKARFFMDACERRWAAQGSRKPVAARRRAASGPAAASALPVAPPSVLGAPRSAVAMAGRPAGPAGSH